MSQKDSFSNETLKQQRKAREDFLELKRMQSGAIIPEPNNNDRVGFTNKEKVKNFWYYNRFLLIGIVLLSLVIGISVKQCASRIDYDLSITVFTSDLISDGDCEIIASYFEKYCDDVNGDGSAHIKVYNCSYTDGEDSQLMYAKKTKLQAILASDSSAVLFITDNTTYPFLNSVSDKVTILENDGVNLGDDFYKQFSTDGLFKMPENLRISRRVISDTTMQKKRTANDCYKAAGIILEGIR